MQSGSLEPVADAQISLSPAAAFQAFETVMNASTTMSLPIQQQIPQYLSLSAEELQMTIRSINRQSMPADFLDALNRLVETRAASPGFPKTLVTDGSGHFTFTDVPPGQYALMAQRDGFFGLPDDGSNRPRFYARVFATVSGASGADVRVASLRGITYRPVRTRMLHSCRRTKREGEPSRRHRRLPQALKSPSSLAVTELSAGINRLEFL